MTDKKAINYRKLSDELDNILNQLQSGELDIDKAINLHERGQIIIKQLQTYLKTAENKITKVALPKK